MFKTFHLLQRKLTHKNVHIISRHPVHGLLKNFLQSPKRKQGKQQNWDDQLALCILWRWGKLQVVWVIKMSCMSQQVKKGYRIRPDCSNSGKICMIASSQVSKDLLTYIPGSTLDFSVKVKSNFHLSKKNGLLGNECVWLCSRKDNRGVMLQCFLYKFCRLYWDQSLNHNLFTNTLKF